LTKQKGGSHIAPSLSHTTVANRYGLRSKHAEKLGFCFSVIGIGQVTSIPEFAKFTLKYGPVGTTAFATRPYPPWATGRTSRRMSPKRWGVSHTHRARSANNRFTAPPAAVMSAVVSAAIGPIGAVVVSAGLNGLGSKHVRFAVFTRGSFNCARNWPPARVSPAWSAASA